MPSVPSRFRTRVADSISKFDNRYAKHAFNMCVYGGAVGGGSGIISL